MNPNGFFLHGCGFANRFHYAGDKGENIPYLSNFYHDIVPYQHCCFYNSDESNESRQRCLSFFERRPPTTCLNYVPPRPGMLMFRSLCLELEVFDYSVLFTQCEKCIS